MLRNSVYQWWTPEGWSTGPVAFATRRWTTSKILWDTLKASMWKPAHIFASSATLMSNSKQNVAFRDTQMLTIDKNRFGCETYFFSLSGARQSAGVHWRPCGVSSGSWKWREILELWPLPQKSQQQEPDASPHWKLPHSNWPLHLLALFRSVYNPACPSKAHNCYAQIKICVSFSLCGADQSGVFHWRTVRLWAWSEWDQILEMCCLWKVPDEKMWSGETRGKLTPGDWPLQLWVLLWVSIQNHACTSKTHEHCAQIIWNKLDLKTIHNSALFQCISSKTKFWNTLKARRSVKWSLLLGWSSGSVEFVRKFLTTRVLLPDT